MVTDRRPTLASRQKRWIQRSIRLGLVLATALALPTGLAWGMGGPDPGGPPVPRRNSAPEIDPTVAVSAITIAAGGILLVGDRVRKSRRNREG